MAVLKKKNILVSNSLQDMLSEKCKVQNSIYGMLPSVSKTMGVDITGLLTLRKVIVGRVHKGGTCPRGTQILHRREH